MGERVKLHANGVATGIGHTVVARVTTSPLERDARPDHWLLWPHDAALPDLDGYAGVLACGTPSWSTDAPLLHSVPQLDYLVDGDVLAADPNGFARTLYRRASRHNFLFMTEQCNSYCLMCSQPPRNVDDSNRLAEQHRLVDLIDVDAQELGITGGEPTLFKDDFLALIAHCKERLPRTALHVLTNGRLFYYRRFAEKLGSIGHPDLVLGIPLYADTDREHDHVVQAPGAFEETLLGLHHLDRYGVKVEIRVVLHKLTVGRLARLAEFIARNLPFAVHVALMGLEMFGLVHRNREQLWIDPADYQPQLAEAVEILARAGLQVSIYNHQLCVLDRALWPYAAQSISDWKNVYADACESCSVRTACGGFFHSGTKSISAKVAPIA